MLQRRRNRTELRLMDSYIQILCTLRSLLNELDHLTVLNTVKQASSFHGDLRVHKI
jgi:hypothetical protein